VNRDQFTAWCHEGDSYGPESFEVKRPLIMGVLNVTPDSFYDGGRYFSPNAAYNHAVTMIESGADIIDIGGESVKPGAQFISLSEELERLIPVIRAIRKAHEITISVDTSKAIVMTEAIAAGASFINDIKALTGEGSVSAMADENVPICLMHMQGQPSTMQHEPYYEGDVVDEINQFFFERIAVCVNAGISRDRLILDPGFGFGKTVQHNLEIVNRLHEFQQHHLPVLLGVSRKSTIGAVLGQLPEARLVGGVAIAVFAMLRGVSIIRTHDVAETKQALDMITAIKRIKE